MSPSLSTILRLDTWLTYIIKAAARHESPVDWLLEMAPWTLGAGDGIRQPLVACRTLSNHRGREQIELQFDPEWLKEYQAYYLEKLAWDGPPLTADRRFKFIIHEELASYAHLVEGAIADETGPLGEPLPRIGGHDGVTACLRCKERPKDADSTWCAHCRRASGQARSTAHKRRVRAQKQRRERLLADPLARGIVDFANSQVGSGFAPWRAGAPRNRLLRSLDAHLHRRSATGP